MVQEVCSDTIRENHSIWQKTHYYKITLVFPETFEHKQSGIGSVFYSLCREDSLKFKRHKKSKYVVHFIKKYSATSELLSKIDNYASGKYALFIESDVDNLTFLDVNYPILVVGNGHKYRILVLPTEVNANAFTAFVLKSYEPFLNGVFCEKVRALPSNSQFGLVLAETLRENCTDRCQKLGNGTHLAQNGGSDGHKEPSSTHGLAELQTKDYFYF